MRSALNDFKSVILTADAKATRYFGRGEGAYTVWSEYELEGLHGGNAYAEVKWRVLVERFTSDENDAIVDSIFNALNGADNIAFRYSVRRDRDQEIIAHSWNCEVV